MVRPKSLQLAFYRRPMFALFFVFAILGLGFVWADAHFRSMLASEPDIVRGTIVMIDSKRSSNRVSANPTFVIAFEDGSRRELDPALRDISDCQIGSEIMVHKRGSNLQIAPVACSPSDTRQ